MPCLRSLRLRVTASVDRSLPAPSVRSLNGRISTLWWWGGMQDMEDPSLQVLFFSRSGTINIPVSYCTLMIEPHLLGVRSLCLTFALVHLPSMWWVTQALLPEQTPPTVVLSPLFALLWSVFIGSQWQVSYVAGCSRGLGSKPPAPSHSSESSALEFWPVWYLISPLSLTLTRLFLSDSFIGRSAGWAKVNSLASEWNKRLYLPLTRWIPGKAKHKVKIRVNFLWLSACGWGSRWYIYI